MALRGLGLRDKNGKELHDGDTVKVVFYDRRVLTGNVNYEKAAACWRVGKQRICEMGREQGTTLEIVDGMPGARPIDKRRKGKPS
jgi:hypothetical protein